MKLVASLPALLIVELLKIVFTAPSRTDTGAGDAGGGEASDGRWDGSGGIVEVTGGGDGW